MQTQYILNEADIKQILAEKFGSNERLVNLKVTIDKPDRPSDSETKTITAVVKMPAGTAKI